ncbi:MAG: c-type cytochrome [Arcobacteraceae bacterium]|nr:c-type cytochrome [Arcobacteraceae bacterium]
MRYIIVGGIVLVVTLLVSKLFLALNLVHFNKYPIASKIEEDNSSKQLLTTGKSIYLVYCSSCHGKDGKGNNDKAQDHTQRMAVKSIIDIINNGSNNFKSIYSQGMPAGLVTQTEAKEVAQYVANSLKGDKPKAWEKCATCHNEDGKGIPFIAPNITTYSDELVSTVLKNGKKGVIGTMPSFEGRFSEVQIQAVANYIRSLEK